MTIQQHIIGQVLATVLQVLNAVSGIIPQKYQAIVTFALTVAQAGMALWNHYNNPDGTPASTAWVKAPAKP